MPPTNAPAAHVSTLPEEYQRAMRTAVREAFFAWVDRAVARDAQERAEEAPESHSEPEQATTVAA